MTVEISYELNPKSRTEINDFSISSPNTELFFNKKSRLKGSFLNCFPPTSDIVNDPKWVFLTF